MPEGIRRPAAGRTFAPAIAIRYTPGIMQKLLVKHWFVLAILGVLLLGVTLAPAVAGPMEQFPLRLMIILVMFFTAVSMPSSAISSALRTPTPVLWALLLGYSVVPGLALLAARTLFLHHTDLAVGLLIAGAVPCTLASAVIWTRLAGGQEAVALLVTLSSNLLCFIVTSAWVAGTTGTDVQLELGPMVRNMFVVIAFPVGLGQALRRNQSASDLADRWKTPIAVLNRCLILLVVLSAAVKAGERFRTTPLPMGLLLTLVATCLGIHLITWSLGWFSGRNLFRFSREATIAVAFSGSQKTLPVGLFVASQYFPQLGLASLPILVYHVTQLVSDTWIAAALANHYQPIPVHEPLTANQESGV